MAASLSTDVDQVAGLLQRGPARAAGRFYYAFAQQRQLEKLASVERQSGHFLVINYIADFGGCALQQGFTTCYRHLVGDVADFEDEFKTRCLAELKHYAVAHRPFESVSFDRNRVFAERQGREEDGSRVIRYSVELQAAGRMR